MALKGGPPASCGKSADVKVGVRVEQGQLGGDLPPSSASVPRIDSKEGKSGQASASAHKATSPRLEPHLSQFCLEPNLEPKRFKV